MSNHSYTKLIYHFVWATEDRKDLIKQEFKKNLYAYIGQISQRKNWHLIAVGGISNHIHILLQKNADSHSTPEIISCLKANSSKFIRNNFDPNFAWQDGYSAFTVDTISLNRLKNYIEKQEEHHNQINYDKELKLILKRYDT